jgi:hypothetical protein
VVNRATLTTETGEHKGSTEKFNSRTQLFRGPSLCTSQTFARNAVRSCFACTGTSGPAGVSATTAHVVCEKHVWSRSCCSRWDRWEPATLPDGCGVRHRHRCSSKEDPIRRSTIVRDRQGQLSGRRHANPERIQLQPPALRRLWLRNSSIFVGLAPRRARPARDACMDRCVVGNTKECRRCCRKTNCW